MVGEAGGYGFWAYCIGQFVDMLSPFEAVFRSDLQLSPERTIVSYQGIISS